MLGQERSRVGVITIILAVGIKMNFSKVMNPQALTSMYGGVPDFSGSEISEIYFKRDEPRLSVKLLAQNKPMSSPVKWPEKYDQVCIELSFIGSRCVSFSEWGHENVVCEMLFDVVSHVVAVTIRCANNSRLEFLCDWVRVESIRYGLMGTP